VTTWAGFSSPGCMTSEKTINGKFFGPIPGRWGCPTRGHNRSVTVSVNEQLSPVQGAPGVFDALRRAEGKAVCTALADW
jgi:hypothetical protein